MREVAAIVQSIDEAACAAVRKAFAELRQAEVLVGKQERKAEEARTTAERRRKQCGEALLEAHLAMGVRQGDRSGRWAKFLAAEGIDPETARRYMKAAGADVDALPSGDGDEREVSTYRDLGIDKRPRSADRPDREITIDNPPRGEREDTDDGREEAGRVEIISRGKALNLREGRWEDALLDVGIVDALIGDPPYGKRTHEQDDYERTDGIIADGMKPNYDAWSADDVTSFVDAWAPRCRGWMAMMTSDDLIPAWKAAYAAHDRFAFAPVPCVINGMSVRRWGDGPSSWAVYLMVSRPRNLSKWRSLPGAYVGPREGGAKGGRGKPTWLMEFIVHDYSHPGDLVCDPMAGFGTTLFAADKLGRRHIGAEMDVLARNEAVRRWHDPKRIAAPPVDRSNLAEFSQLLEAPAA